MTELNFDPSALAASVAPSTGLVIGGRSVESTDGSTFATLDPATGAELAQVSEGTSADVDLAVAAARAAFDTGPWAKMSPSDRRMLLKRFALLVEAHADELAVLESLDGGKPIFDTSSIDLPETVGCLLWHAEMADKIYDLASPSGPGVVSTIVREPIGVVAAVLPWNFPLLMAAWKIGPALAAGNTMVLKPAEQTSLSTIRMVELATEAGLPDGVLNVVPGFGETTGRALGLHADVDCVAFTGSTEVGRHFLRYSADSNLKRVLLECGGKNPMVVFGDAEDLDAVAASACEAVFWNAGQNCSSNSRLIIQESIVDPVMERIDEALHVWVVGNPLDPETRIGALIEPGHLEKVMAGIEAAKSDGATIRSGGRQTRMDSGGWFVEPTVIENVTSDMSLSKDELFGPVLGVETFADADRGVALANDTDYGLHASVFTSNLRTAHLAARSIRAGTVSVNAYSEGDISTPFGGYGLSGFGGRDNGIHAHEQYTETKTVWLDLS